MLALGLVAAVAACDPLATGSFKPPYVIIAGQIDGSTATEMPRDVHVAVLWQNDVTPGSNYAVLPIDVIAQFPAAFRVPIVDKPAAPVIDTLQSDTALALGVDPAMSWSVGTLVVFADGNFNGKLDITNPGDPPSPDLVLAADLDIFWLGAGRPASSAFVDIFPITSGFSLVRDPPQMDPAPGDCGHFDANGHYTDLCGPTTAPVPLDIDSYTEHMTLTDDSRLQGYTCSAYWGPLEYPDFDLVSQDQICDGGACPICRGYQCPIDLPPTGVPVTCSLDNLSYVYKTCVDHAELCGTRFCHFGHGERLAADPPPSGWPCPQ